MRRRRAEREAASPDLDLATAMEVALRFLGTRPRTRWELDRRLRRAGAPEPVIVAAMERLTELGYVDDAAFARWWGEQRDRHSPRGRRMLETELRQRGVPREVIEELRGQPVARVPGEEALPETEAERARIAMERHLRGRPRPQDRAALQRLGTYLLRRGFDPETVRSILRDASTDGARD
jgi:regulatory protein